MLPAAPAARFHVAAAIGLPAASQRPCFSCSRSAHHGRLAGAHAGQGRLLHARGEARRRLGCLFQSACTAACRTAAPPSAAPPAAKLSGPSAQPHPSSPPHSLCILRAATHIPGAGAVYPRPGPAARGSAGAGGSACALSGTAAPGVTTPTYCKERARLVACLAVQANACRCASCALAFLVPCAPCALWRLHASL